MLRPVLMALTLLVGSSTSAGAEAGDVVVAHGHTTLFFDCLYYGEQAQALVVTVQSTPAGPKATLYWDNWCFLLFQVVPHTAGTGVVFDLEGSWETGFVGRTPPGLGTSTHSTLLLGPYGDGTDIAITAYLGCCTGNSGMAFKGILADTRLV